MVRFLLFDVESTREARPETQSESVWQGTLKAFAAACFDLIWFYWIASIASSILPSRWTVESVETVDILVVE